MTERTIIHLGVGFAELLDGQVRGHNLRFSVILGGIFQSPAIKGLNLHEVSRGREAFTTVANKNLK